MLGVAYYPEHWELSRMEIDLHIMKENGIDLIRVGEFMWDKLEPKETHYNFSILDKLFELCENKNISVILGTPSATPPIWIARKHPEIFQKDSLGHVRHFGSRRQYCYNSHTYKKYVENIVRKIADRYGKKKALYAWQIDNEFGCEDTTYCYCEKCDKAFQVYLKKNYDNINQLNNTWGTSFWSQSYNDFYQIETPKKTNAFPNPHHTLDFYRFSTYSINEFAKSQIEIIRKYSDKPITHNFMVNYTEIDYSKHKELYDFISYDNYIPTDIPDHNVTAFNLDLMRSLKNKCFTVMEQQPGRVNWQVRNVYYSAKYLMPSTVQAYLHGADNLLYFRYRALPYGAEQYHNGVLNYDGKPDKSPRLNIVKDLSNLVGTIPKQNKADVAIYFDYEVAWMHRINGVSRDFNYLNAIIDIYSAVRSTGKSVDIVFKDSSFDNYKLLIIPYAIYLPDNITGKIKSFKGKTILTCMTAIKNTNSHIISNETLRINFDSLNFDILDFGAIYNEDISFDDNMNITASYWTEYSTIHKGNVIAKWKNPELKDNPGIIESIDKNMLYVATVPNRTSWKFILEQWLGYNCWTPENIELIMLDNGDQEQNVFYLLNFGKDKKLDNIHIQACSYYTNAVNNLPEYSGYALSPDVIENENNKLQKHKISVDGQILSVEELEELQSYIEKKYKEKN